MNAPRRPSRPSLLLPVLLFAVAMPASAREVSKQGPNGNGGSCPGVAATVEVDAEVVTTTKRDGAPVPARSKAAPMMRSGDSDNERPRWHSFLPGMFR